MSWLLDFIGYWRSHSPVEWRRRQRNPPSYLWDGAFFIFTSILGFLGQPSLRGDRMEQYMLSAT
ncbi:MAG: hypothetical protein F6J94_30295 [Moorea sp. SIO1F2]|uniref:hypothetical protein n=1 Tax=Moorena sp. SIO1F2 TaxID=2607819 RepID=UPI0013B88F9A|nr:hypothetical protein [Moorena sp. SIO1F2]NEO02493.1 hypothetical protein [Moorena sp. SIO3I7]NET86019.1 hypothetical protein [Moorena sp. SIO1F2]